MKNNTLAVKVLCLLFILFNVSCTSDDGCNENNIPVNFPLKIKLVSLEGENLFNDNNFNLSLLKITETSDSNVAFTFSQIVENGETLITFQALNRSSVNFKYDAVDKFYFGFHNIKTQLVNCTIEVTSYMALRINGDLVCDCSVDEVLVITLDL